MLKKVIAMLLALALTLSCVFALAEAAPVETPAPVQEASAAPVAPEAAPEATAKATPEATVEAAPEATVEATPEATVEATPEATVEATVEATPEATVEATPEATVEATPEATVEATPEATVEATPEATVEATPEATVEATPEATTEASAEPTEVPSDAEQTPVPSFEPAATQLPEDAQIVVTIEDALNPSRYIEIYAAFEGDFLNIGDNVTLYAVLHGYDGLIYELQWQVQRGGEWIDIEYETDDTYEFTLTEENCDDTWRIEVTITDMTEETAARLMAQAAEEAAAQAAQSVEENLQTAE